jgi:hypothetical protein
LIIDRGVGTASDDTLCMLHVNRLSSCLVRLQKLSAILWSDVLAISVSTDVDLVELGWPESTANPAHHPIH